MTQAPQTHNDRSALAAQWLAAHGDALWRFAVSRVGDQAAEDIVQETLVAALAGAASFQGRSSAETWLLGIMHNKVVDHYRRRARELASRTPADEPPDSADGEFRPDGHWAVKPSDWSGYTDAAEDPLRVAYRHCMGSLPLILRDALELRELRDLPPETVCQELGITATNLWTRLHRARAALRLCIENRLNPARKERKR